MARKKKAKVKLDVNSSQEAQGFRGGLAGALSLAGFDTPSAEEEPLDDAVSASDHQEANPSLLSPLNMKRALILNLSKKGRGGKVVTTLQLLSASDEQARSRLAKAMGKALGCRAWLEEHVLYLQGDQRDRVQAWVDEVKD